MSLVDTLGFVLKVTTLGGVVGNPITGSITSTKTTVPSQPLTINPTLSPNQKAAVQVAQNLKMSTAILASPLNQQIISAVRARATTNVITKSGNTIVPTNTLTEYQQQAAAQQAQITAFSAVNTLMGTQLAAQTAQINKLSNAMNTLSQGTVQGSVTQAQLATTTKAYEAVVNTPTAATSTDIFGQIGDFINKYGLYIALGVGAIIFLPMITKLIPQRKET